MISSSWPSSQSYTLTIQCLFWPSMPPIWNLDPKRCLSLQSSWNPSHKNKINWWWWATSNLPKTKLWFLEIRGWIQKERRKLRSHLRDDSLTDSFGKGRIDLDHGKFSNVLYVPGLASNLLSVYQMTHTYFPLMMLRSQISQMANSLQKELYITLRRYTCFHIFYPTQTPLLFRLMLMRQEIFGMKYLSILSISIFLI